MSTLLIPEEEPKKYPKELYIEYTRNPVKLKTV